MAKIIVFNKKDFKGKKTKQYGENVPSLKSTGLNNDISSIIVISGTWELFKHTDYKGTVWTVSDSGGPDGDGTYLTPDSWSGSNNEISSLKVQGT